MMEVMDNFSGFPRFLQSSRSFPQNPWIYFSIFVFTNSLLSYGNGSFRVNLWLFFLGLVIPMAMAFASKLRPSSAPIHQAELLDSIPTWFCWTICGAALILRIGQLTFWAQWPASDSSLCASYSMELSEKWFWRFFFAHAQNPAVFNWGLAVFYKIFTPGLFPTRLYPLLISALVMGATYWSARTYFSKSLSMFCLMVSATGFWILYAGEFCFPHILALLWQILGLGFLGRLALSASPRDVQKNAAFLGLVMGTGFFIGIGWPIVFFGVILALAGLWLPTTSRISFLSFSIPFVTCLLLFLWAGAHEHYGQHLRSLWILKSESASTFKWSDLGSNLTALFWRNLSGGFGPHWGGMWNPLLSSFFFLGLVEFKNVSLSPFLKWLLFGLLIGIAPGFLSSGFDIFRLIHSVPFQAIIAGLGFQRLLEPIPAPQRIRWFLPLFLASTCLDSFHIQTPALANLNTENLSKAYDILKNTTRSNGPGFILTDLTPLNWDHSLDLAVYPFNMITNKRIVVSATRWVAILVNQDYLPFLNRRLSDVQWYDLGNDGLGEEGDRFLGVITIQPTNAAICAPWLNADIYFRKVNFEFLNNLPFEPLETLVQKLEQIPLGKNPDPFLESCLCEKVLFLMPENNPSRILPVAQLALERGFNLPLFSWFKKRAESLGN